MGSFRSTAMCIALGGSLTACAEQAYSSPQKPKVVVIQTASNETRDRGENMVRDTFMVFWTIDYGYRLNPENDLDVVITPEFDNKDVVQKFDQFFSNENLSRNVGKRIYCDCVGERYQKDGRDFYKVREARIFAK